MVELFVANEVVGGSNPLTRSMSRSSSGLGHRPFTAKITGSNPVRDTKFRNVGRTVMQHPAKVYYLRVDRVRLPDVPPS